MAMQINSGLLVLAAFGLLGTGCAASSGAPNDPTSSDPTTAAETSPVDGTTPAAESTPAPATTPNRRAKRLALAPVATNLQVSGGKVFYESLGALYQVPIDGSSAPTLALASNAVTHARYWIDGADVFSSVWQGGCFGANLLGLDVASKLSVAVGIDGCATTNAPKLLGVALLGADALGYYVASVSASGTRVERWARITLKRTLVFSHHRALSDLHMVKGWLVGVADGKDVIKSDLGHAADAILEPLATIDGCRLATVGDAALCATPTAVWQLPATVGDAPTMIVDATNGAIGTANGAIGEVIAAGNDLFLTDAASAAVSAAAMAANGLLGSVDTTANDLGSAAEDLANAVGSAANGIANAANAGANGIASAADGAANGIANATGSAANGIPSTVTAANDVTHTLSEIKLPALPTSPAPALVAGTVTTCLATTKGAITSVAADATHVVYAEHGAGIFSLPR